MFALFLSFLHGTFYVAQGCCAFYGDRKAWKYAVFPLGIMTLVYILACWGILHITTKLTYILSHLIAKMPPWLSVCIDSISYLLGFGVAILLLGITICTFYEILGGFFFDALIEYYEQKKFGAIPIRFSVRESLKNGFHSFYFGIRTVLFFILLFIPGLFFPIIGQLILISVMGYYLGISYITSSGNHCGMSIPQLEKRAQKKCAMILGFGMTAYILLLIPFSTIFLLPGFVLGGVELFHHQLKEDS